MVFGMNINKLIPFYGIKQAKPRMFELLIRIGRIYIRGDLCKLVFKSHDQFMRLRFIDLPYLVFQSVGHLELPRRETAEKENKLYGKRHAVAGFNGIALDTFVDGLNAGHV